MDRSGTVPGSRSRLRHPLVSGDDRIDGAVLLDRRHQHGAVDVVHGKPEQQPHDDVVDPAGASTGRRRAAPGRRTSESSEPTLGASAAQDEPGGDRDEVQPEHERVGRRRPPGCGPRTPGACRAGTCRTRPSAGCLSAACGCTEHELVPVRVLVAGEHPDHAHEHRRGEDVGGLPVDDFHPSHQRGPPAGP